MDKLLGRMDADEFEEWIDAFVEQRSGEDDRLSAEAFFDLLAEPLDLEQA